MIAANPPPMSQVETLRDGRDADTHKGANLAKRGPKLAVSHRAVAVETVPQRTFRVVQEPETCIAHLPEKGAEWGLERARRRLLGPLACLRGLAPVA
jgi:hypothetical protein